MHIIYLVWHRAHKVNEFATSILVRTCLFSALTDQLGARRTNMQTTRRPPRTLLGVDGSRDDASSTSANANPDLACSGCPTTDTRTEVTDTTAAPWDAIGLLMREEQQALTE